MQAGVCERGGMLEIVSAVIKPHRLQIVEQALRDAGIDGITVTESRGFGRQRGHDVAYRGNEYTIDFVAKVEVSVLCDAADTERVAAVISTAASTGTIGDGKVWVQRVERALRVRTGEADADAL